MVKFCDQCGSILRPVTATGELSFLCVCGKSFGSTPEDSLRSEEYMGPVANKQKYMVFIDNSPYDTAGNRVKRECPACFMPFLTLIFIGEGETPLFTCNCGQKYTVQDLEIQDRENQSAKNQSTEKLPEVK